jgi:hypothetical protein
MTTQFRAIETFGTVDEKRHLRLDDPSIDLKPGKVRVIILMPEEGEADELEWLRAASRSPAFEFLADPREDIYSIEDGKPFHDEG